MRERASPPRGRKPEDAGQGRVVLGVSIAVWTVGALLLIGVFAAIVIAES